MIGVFKLNYSKLCPELQLLMELCCPEIDSNIKNNIEKLIENKIDWNLFMKYAVHHKVYPLIYKSINNIKDIPIPNNVHIYFKNKYKENAFNSMKITAELLKFMKLFNKNDMQVLPYKGPILAYQIYNDISLRVSRDLDFIIREEDLFKIEEILFKEGYNLEDDYSKMNRVQLKNIMKKLHHIVYHNKEKNITIEIHFKYLLPYFYYNNISFEYLWNKRDYIYIYKTSIPVLSKEDNYLLTAYHGAKHGWFRLKWLCDFAYIIKKGDIPYFQRLDNINIEKEAIPILGQIFLLCNEFFHVSIPVKYKYIQTHRKSNKLAKAVVPYFSVIDNFIFSSKSPWYIPFKLYFLSLLTGFNNKAKFILLHLHPSMDETKALNLQGAMLYGYYVIRPFIWIRKRF